MTQAIVMLRRWTLPAVLALALALNVCGLPLESHLHPAAEEGAAAIPAGDHHDGELVSCDAHTSQLPTQPQTLLGPTPSAALDAIVPVPHACGHAPIVPVSIPYRPPLFLLHASLLI
jgi:hypothetical protein